LRLWREEHKCGIESCDGLRCWKGQLSGVGGVGAMNNNPVYIYHRLVLRTNLHADFRQGPFPLTNPLYNPQVIKGIAMISCASVCALNVALNAGLSFPLHTYKLTDDLENNFYTVIQWCLSDTYMYFMKQLFPPKGIDIST
jgi:hypothetical protein